MTTQITPITLTKAAIRAAERLDLIACLPSILELSRSDVDELRQGQRLLAREQAEWNAATDLVSLYRLLLTQVPSPEDAVSWLRAPHPTLGAAPIELLREPDGRSRVLRYLDAVQKYEIKLQR